MKRYLHDKPRRYEGSQSSLRPSGGEVGLRKQEGSFGIRLLSSLTWSGVAVADANDLEGVRGREAVEDGVDSLAFSPHIKPEELNGESERTREYVSGVEREGGWCPWSRTEWWRGPLCFFASTVRSSTTTVLPSDVIMSLLIPADEGHPSPEKPANIPSASSKRSASIEEGCLLTGTTNISNKHVYMVPPPRNKDHNGTIVRTYLYAVNHRTDTTPLFPPGQLPSLLENHPAGISGWVESERPFQHDLECGFGSSISSIITSNTVPVSSVSPRSRPSRRLWNDYHRTFFARYPTDLPICGR